MAARPSEVIDTDGTAVSDADIEPATPSVEHAFGCLPDRCVPECPYSLSLLSDSDLEALTRDAHQVGAWALRYLTDDSGAEDEGLISRGLRLFGGKSGS